MDKKKIYWVVGIIGLSIGSIIGRYIYLNNIEAKQGGENFTPDVMEEITNNQPETLDEVTTQDGQISKELMESEMMTGMGDY
jgi:hypothetical protein